MICGEPYVALMLWLDAETGKYVARVWNQTVSAGSATKLDQGGNSGHFLGPFSNCLLEFHQVHTHACSKLTFGAQKMST